MENDTIVKLGVIDWVSTKNKALKLMGDSVYKMTDGVTAIDFKGLGIVKNAKVEMKIAGDTVVFIKADSGSVTPQPAKKEEVKTPVNANTKKIKAIAPDKAFMKFEGQVIWVGVSDAIKAMDFESLGIRAGAEVEVNVVGVDEEQVIDSIKVVVKTEVKPPEAKVETKVETKTEVKPEIKSVAMPVVAPKVEVNKGEPAKPVATKAYVNETQNSIEVQCCLKAAVEIVNSVHSRLPAEATVTLDEAIKEVELAVKEVLRIFKAAK
jgi:hypothetical protein